jgi:hypothetical protein
MMVGESYDARLEMTGWPAPGLTEDSRWTSAVILDDPRIELTAMTGPTVKAIKEIKNPKATSLYKHPWANTGGDNWIFDFGQNLVGRLRLKVKGRAGTTVAILHGFRYAEVTNLPNEVTADTATVAGIEIDADRPGYEHIILRPHLLAGGPLTFAKATVETLRGPVESGWKITDGKFLYTVKIPPNVTATAYIPETTPNDITESGKPVHKASGVRMLNSDKKGATFELKSGAYQFASSI